MSSSGVSLSLFLLACLHASSAWDSSNIWFPDVNNPVFYNMTFYQEAAKAINRGATAAPGSDRRNPSPDRRPAAAPTEREQARPSWSSPAETEQARPSWSRTAPRTQSGVKTNRISGQQNPRNRESFQDTEVGYRSEPLDEDRAKQLLGMFSRNNVVKTNRQPSGNRLQVRQDEEAMTRYERFQDRDVRQSSQGDGWNGNRNTDFQEVNTGMGGNRNVASSEGSRRDWDNRSMAGSVATNTVEGDIISDIETSSKASGPSKCVWAIISCCKPTSTEIRYACFETLGCHGAFWDNNPCSKEMTLAAVRATATFYNVPVRED